MSDRLLTLSDVHLNFPARKNWRGKVVERVYALNGLDMTAYRGATLGIVGESGCGKSTLARLLMGMLKPSSGRFDRGGDSAAGGDAGRMQMVFQDPLSSLDPRLPVWRTITEPVWIQSRPGEKARRALAERLALQVGLRPEYLDRLPHAFSGGQRQRIAIARALSAKPDIIVLDEPTSALDIAHQVDVLALVHRLSEQRGLTVIAVLHDINMAARYCDYLVALRGGEMIAQGTPNELMRSETLEHIYGIPMGILPHPAGAAPVSFVY